MPGIDGIEVCRQINRTIGIAVNSVATIMLSSRKIRENVARGLHADARDFAWMSHDLTGLKARVEALLRRKFLEREYERVLAGRKGNEMESPRTTAGKEAVEAKAALAKKLTQRYKELEASSKRPTCNSSRPKR